MTTVLGLQNALGPFQGGGIIVLQVRVTDRFGEEAGAAAKDEVWGVRQFRRKSRRCGYSDFDILCGEDRVRENCRRFGVLLATLLLAVPACWGIWSSRVYLTAAGTPADAGRNDGTASRKEIPARLCGGCLGNGVSGQQDRTGKAAGRL